MSELSRDFKGIWIPKEIWLRKDISMQAKMLWAEIWHLHDDEKGGCFASDEYLMEFIQLKQSRLYEIYKELKDAGLLKTVKCDGRRAIRKALIPYKEDDLTGMQTGTQRSTVPENRNDEFRKTAPPSYIEKKEEKKDIDIKADRTPQKKKHGNHVALTDQEFDLLCSQHTKPVIQELIETMNDWISSGKGKPYKDYAAALRNWVKNRKHQPTQRINNETVKQSISRKHLEEYAKSNGSFNDCVHDFSNF